MASSGQLPRSPTTLETFGGADVPYKITECSIKRFPLGQYSQTVVQAALEARDKMPEVRVDDIAEVQIRTLQKAIDIMAGDDEKWDPEEPGNGGPQHALHRCRRAYPRPGAPEPL